VQEANPALHQLPRGMRRAIEEVLEPGEEVLGVWRTRGVGANALVCAPARALIAKRTDLIRWSVGAFRYSEIGSVDMLDTRPGATQVELAPLEPGPAPQPGPFDDFPDAYYQESRRLVAPNTVMFRSRGRAREAVKTLQGLIAKQRD
jgi:hypothetical protein